MTNENIELDAASLILTVQNTAPIVALDPMEPIPENGLALLTGRYLDLGTLDSHTVTVNWDDPNNDIPSTFQVDAHAELNVGETFVSTSGDGALLTILGLTSYSVQFAVEHPYLDDGPAPGNETVSDLSLPHVTVIDDDGGESKPFGFEYALGGHVMTTLSDSPNGPVGQGEATDAGLLTGTVDYFTISGSGNNFVASSVFSTPLGTIEFRGDVTLGDGVFTNHSTVARGTGVFEGATGTVEFVNGIFFTGPDGQTHAQADMQGSIHLAPPPVFVSGHAMTILMESPNGPVGFGAATGAGLLDGVIDYSTVSEDGNDFVGRSVFTTPYGSLELLGEGTLSNGVFTNDSIVSGGTGLFAGATGTITFLNGVYFTGSDGQTHAQADMQGTLFLQGGTQLIIHNATPSINGLNAPVIDENGIATLSGQYSDEGTLDTHTVSIDWGDGTTSTALVDPVSRTFSANHQYLDDDPSGTPSDIYTVSVTLTDDDMGVDVALTTVAVQNVVPVVLLDPPGMISENGTATLTGRYQDPGTLDGHLVTVDWDDPNNSTPSIFSVDALVDLSVGKTFVSTSGDGSSLTILSLLSGVVQFQVQHQYLDDGLAPGNGTVSDFSTPRVTILDDDGGESSGHNYAVSGHVMTTLTDSPDGPVGSGESTGAGLLDGGVEYSTVSEDGDDFVGRSVFTTPYGSLELLGEGTLSNGVFTNDSIVSGGTGHFAGATGTITFLNGVYFTGSDGQTHAQADMQGTLFLQGGTPVVINNISPVIESITNAEIEENGLATLIGNFTDVGPMDTHTVLINWGDGITSPALVDPVSRTFSATHQYLDDDPSGTPSDIYTVSVTLTDDDLGVDVALTTVTVQNVVPVITAFASDATFVEKALPGETVNLMGAFLDIGTLDTHVAVIDWGDNTSSEAMINPTTRSIAADHVYSTGGIFTIGITLTDDDGGRVSQITTAVVTGVRLTPTGELQIVGTNGDDLVIVKAIRNQNVIMGIGVETQFAGLAKSDHLFAVEDVIQIVAYACEGDDLIAVQDQIDIDAYLYGGEGNDVLTGGGGNDVITGGAGNDILIGGGGSDQLDGGTGRNLLIGGTDADLLIGGIEEDLMITGYTSYDQDAPALSLILAEWSSSRTYQERIDNLRDGKGDVLKGTKIALATTGKKQTVFDDGVADSLAGNDGLDWFFGSLTDTLVDKQEDEFWDLL